MGKLSETDKHNPIIQTDQPTPEIPKPTIPPPGHHKNEVPVRKEVQRNQDEQNEANRRTGSR